MHSLGESQQTGPCVLMQAGALGACMHVCGRVSVCVCRGPRGSVPHTLGPRCRGSNPSSTRASDNLSGPQFSYLLNGNKGSITLPGCCEDKINQYVQNAQNSAWQVLPKCSYTYEHVQILLKNYIYRYFYSSIHILP